MEREDDRVLDLGIHIYSCHCHSAYTIGHVPTYAGKAFKISSQRTRFTRLIVRFVFTMFTVYRRVNSEFESYINFHMGFCTDELDTFGLGFVNATDDILWYMNIDGQYLKLQDRHKHRKVPLIPNMFIRLNKEHPLAGELSTNRRNKSDISCLKNQPDAFPVQYTQLSLGQATKLQL